MYSPAVFAPLGSVADHAAILANRERRADAQRALIGAWGCPVISFSLNIPGPGRDSEAAERCFASGLAALEEARAVSGMALCERVLYRAATGPEALLCVRGEAAALKRAMLAVEETHPLGRLFDLDVLTADAAPFGRAAFGLGPRRCLVCERPAAECRRAGRHSLEALYEAISALLRRVRPE